MCASTCTFASFLVPMLALLFHSNLWIALGALAAAWQTYHLLQAPINTALLGFIFCATWALYILHRRVGAQRFESNAPLPRFRFITEHHYLFNVLLLLLLASCVYLFFQLTAVLQYAILAASLPAAGYVFPIWRGRRLRDLPYLKIILVALVWAYMTVFLPLLDLLPPRWIASEWLRLAERALWIFLLVLPFDLRDRQLDQSQSVRTFANHPHPALLPAISLVGIALWLLLCGILYPPHFFTIWLLSALVLIVLIRQAARGQYVEWTDGLLLAQAIAVFLLR